MSRLSTFMCRGHPLKYFKQRTPIMRGLSCCHHLSRSARLHTENGVYCASLYNSANHLCRLSLNTNNVGLRNYDYPISRCYSTEKSGSDGGNTKDIEPSKPKKFEMDVIAEELANITENRKLAREQATAEVPKETDVAIIGGGSFGLSVAYWLKKEHPRSFHVTVIERDPTYSSAWTTRGLASLSHQFGEKRKKYRSMFSAEFYREMKEYLGVLDLDPPDIQFQPQGYLLLAKDTNGKEILERNYVIQRECNAQTELLDPANLKNRFPWLKTDDLTLGSYGLANEGWFDPWLYLSALKIKCLSLGVQFVKGNVTGFGKDPQAQYEAFHDSEGNVTTKERLQSVQISMDGKMFPMKFAMVVNCAGPWSGEVARLAGIGMAESGPLAIPLPVEPRKRYVYVFHCPDGPGMNMPMLIDASGTYVRREGFGGHYLCGATPPTEPTTENLDVDYEFFNETIWPTLAERIPPFENLKLKSAWAGFYDYNYYDQNLIIGNHPYFRNFFMATGCSGHGVQQSPAIGRALAEYIMESGFTTIDLDRMSFDRVMTGDKLLEEAPYII